VRVNLICSILVFRKKKYYLHDNAKLVFFKKKRKKKKKKFTRTVQVNCTVHANIKFKKAARAASPISRKRELTWTPPKLNSVFNITKHYICYDYFKCKSNHATNRPINKWHIATRKADNIDGTLIIHQSSLL